MTRSTLAARLATATALALTVVGGSAIVVLGGAPALAADSAIGPAIGSKVSLDARVLDASGRATTLARIGAGRPMMLVLFRSAKWCPYCQAQLKGLGPVAAAAKARRVGFTAISYDAPAVLGAFAGKHALTYPLYSDTGSKLIDALGVRDPRYPAGNFAAGVPYPTILMIDAKGVVRAKSVEIDYKVRPTHADMIAMLAKV